MRECLMFHQSTFDEHGHICLCDCTNKHLHCQVLWFCRWPKTKMQRQLEITVWMDNIYFNSYGGIKRENLFFFEENEHFFIGKFELSCILLLCLVASPFWEKQKCPKLSGVIFDGSKKRDNWPEQCMFYSKGLWLLFTASAWSSVCD